MAPAETRFAVLLFTDIVGSTALKERHGVPAYSSALVTHNQHFERLARECHLTILQNMGDGFFAEVGGVAEALRFALLFQDAMRAGPWGELSLSTRVGIHAGEITAVASEGGSGIVSPAADLAARVMSVALGGQILLTRFPFDEARHFIREHPPVGGKAMPPLRWLAHGPYLMKGRDEPLEIFEIGAEGLAPLMAPPDAEKARRAIRPGEEETLGWRPAAGLEIPGRSGWHLIDLLGAGGFGEVWVGEHGKLHQRRAFKFCFDDERLRALKREVTLVRLLGSALGERDDIVKIHELKLDEPPFYLETDLAPHGNLLQWAENQGGLENIPIETRIGLVAHTATALAAAHSIGVLHKDIKPTNILIFDGPDGEPRPRLVDFGISALTDASVLGLHGVTAAGFTRPTIEHSTGTPTYSPPEYLAGRPYTIQGDVYGLGVLLYQLVTGKALEPLAPGWERDISDPLLRDDIANCVDGDPARRLPSAAELAERLLQLDQRRVEIEKQEYLARAEAARAEAETSAIAARLRATRFSKLAAAFAVLGLLAIVSGVLAWVSKKQTGTALGEVEKQKAVVEEQKTVLEKKNEEMERKIQENYDQIAEAANKAYGTARDVFAGGKDPRTGFAHLAEALRYSTHLPPERQLAVLHRDAVQHVITSPTPNPPVVGDAMRDQGIAQNVRISPDGRFVVTVSSDHTAQIREVATNKPVGEPLTHEEYVLSASFSPDGGRVVTASEDMTARIWDAATGKPVGEPMRHGQYVNNASFSPDGRSVVTASGDNTARLWNATTGNPLGEPMRHGDQVISASFSLDGTRIVTASEDMTARIWDVATGKLEGDPMSHENTVNNASFSPDGRRVVTASDDNSARLWDAATGKPVGEPMPHEDDVYNARFSLDGRVVVTVSAYGTERLWDAATGNTVGEPMRHESFVENASFSPDGRFVVTASQDRTARLWDAATGKPVGEPMRHERSVHRASFSPDGRCVVTASRDNTARLWDAATGNPLGGPMSHEGQVLSASFSPDGRRVVTGSLDKTARLWDAATGKPVGEPMRHEQYVLSAGFSPDGGRVVTASEDKTARLWDVATGKPVGDPMSHENRVNNASFSPDGRHVVTSSDDNSARLWDAATGEPVGEAMRHKNGVLSASFSPDGRRVVTAGFDKAARLWDAATGKPVGEPMRHEEYVLSASFSPNGRFVVTASRDKTARLWDAATGKPVGGPMRHEGGLSSVSFSPDGKRVVTASGDRTARLWNTEFQSFARTSVNPNDIIFLAGKKINVDGEAVDIPQSEITPWRLKLLAQPAAQDDAWHSLLRWKLSDPSTRTITFHGTVTAPEHIEREITWALSDPYAHPSILTEAYDRDPGSPLILLALAAIEENGMRREFLRDYGLKRLAAAEVISDQAAHQAFAGTYRAKAAIILALQGDTPRASRAFADLLAKHDPQRQTWGSPAWLAKLDDFEWPKVFRETLLGLAK